MAIVQNKKINKAMDELLKRQDYLVTQANDLARSFGNLTTFEHKVLDFCFSFVKNEDDSKTLYQADSKDILRHLGLNLSGFNYKRVVQAFKALNEKTAIYMQTTMLDGSQGIMMTSLFDHISVGINGKTEFSFNKNVAPFVFQLRERYYSFKLSEIARVRSKYTLTLMKLWNANGPGKWNTSMNKLPEARIEGSVEDWERWFLGGDIDGNIRYLSPGIFKRDVLNRALKELGSLYPKVIFNLTTIKRGVKVVGYILEIVPVNTGLDI